MKKETEVKTKNILDNERRYNMAELKSKKASLSIHIDEDGYIIDAKSSDGSEIKYHPEEKKRIHGSRTRLQTPNVCCWKPTPLGLRCLPCT